MKEKISMLMDGELDEDEVAPLISRMKAGDDDDWLCYHLICDVIRDPAGFRADIKMDCSESIRSEPVVLAPYKSSLHRAKVYTLSAAASFAAVMLVGWVAMQSPSVSPVPKRVAQAVHLDVIKSKLGDYLLAHQEVSPESEAVTSNIRTVSETYEEPGR